MKIVVNIAHPAHVHYFKNFIWEMERRGHEILIIAIEKDVAFRLLNIYGFDYKKIGKHRSSLIKKIYDIPSCDIRSYQMLKSINPDIFIGSGSIIGSHVSFMLRKKCINFEDTEYSMGQIKLYMPFTDAVCTPSCFKHDLGKKQFRYNGYIDLAYLHPNHFKPKSDILDEMGLSKNETFIIVRFISWTASHDIGKSGVKNRVKLVRELEKFGKVLISSEGRIEKELDTNKINIPPEKLHDLMYYASLYVGEGGSMASEAAVLGTHAFHISKNAKYAGVFEDLQKYNLMWISDNEMGVVNSISKLMECDPKKEGKKQREKLLKDKIDVASFMCWFVENYPESSYIMLENPSYQNRFK
jgi:uncharacterized protein